jgi:HEAT repeat protein
MKRIVSWASSVARAPARAAVFAMLVCAPVAAAEKPDVGALAHSLNHEDAAVRLRAARGLGSTKDVRALGPLVGALRDANASIRAAAAESLGNLGYRTVFRELIEALDDRDPGVRSAAAAALGKLGDDRAAKRLGELLRTDDAQAVRSAAAASLSAVAETGMDQLLKSLASGDGDAVTAASESLHKMGSAAATTLVARLRTRYSERTEWSENRRCPVSAALTAIGGAAVKPLIAALKDHRWAGRAAAAEILGAIGKPALASLDGLLHSKNHELRNLAAKAINRAGGGRVNGERPQAVPEKANAERRPPAPPRPREIDKIVRRVRDTVQLGVTWLVYEKKFVARSEDGTLTNFGQFVNIRNIEGVSVNALAFSDDHVWAATTAGAFCYERKMMAWIEYAVNRHYIGMPVDAVHLAPGNTVVFEMKIKGRTRKYVLDLQKSTWTER